MSDQDIEDLDGPWDCPFGDYDSWVILDEGGEVEDTDGGILECDKPSAPFCEFCPKRLGDCDGD